MWSKVIASVLAVAPALLGCAGEISGVSIELGTGEEAFVPLEDNAELAVILGTQGGYHVLGNLRVHGLPAADDAVESRFWLVTAGGAMHLADEPVRARLRRDGEGGAVLAVGHHVLVVDAAAEASGTAAEFGVEVVAPDGAVAVDVRPVVLASDGL